MGILSDLEALIDDANNVRSALDGLIGQLQLQYTPEVELIIDPGITYTTQPTLVKNSLNNYTISSGVWTHGTPGATAIGALKRSSGGCFRITSASVVSGTLTRTSYTPCGGAATYGNGVIINQCVSSSMFQRLGNVTPFEIDFTVELC